MSQAYNAPPGTPSTIGEQINDTHYQKKALIEARKEQYFTQLANVVAMPKNMGKKISQYHYIPILDDQNINDQGIDANGAVISMSTYVVTLAALVQTYVLEADATAAAAAINAITSGVAVKTGSATPWTVTSSTKTLAPTTQVLSAAVLAAVPHSTRKQGSGNLYASSKDVGTISGKFPVLGEHGGRVNRVGVKRKTIEGTLESFGIFDEYTQESLDFDTDADLAMHINREMVNAANEMTEDMLQIDLLLSAGVVKYAGDATQDSEVGSNDLVTYGDLLRLSIDLDNNRTPKHTTIITGTRMTDTKTVNSARYMYVGSELMPTLKAMEDLHGNPAYVSVEKYAAGTTVATGEEGSIDRFRIIVVPEMLHWEGVGATVTDAINYDNGVKYNVYPMLVIGDESFTTISFMTDGKGVKFKIMHQSPGEKTMDANDPYGKTGRMSIQWYYGFMALRPERIAVLKTVARM